MLPATSSYPLVARVMFQFKADLLNREADQMQVMAKRWLQMETSLQGAFDALALEIENLRLKGEPVPVSKLIRMQRYRSLLGQMSEQLSLYADFADQTIRAGQEELIGMGIDHAAQAIHSYYRTYNRIAGGFDILPTSAIENMIGLAGDGSPVHALLQKSWPEAVDGLTTQLVRAVALGKNPMDTARAMRDGFGVGYSRAINIARTEQLRAYRTAAVQEYKASGVVKGYKRLSARDTRVCLACLMADDGTVYDLDVVFEEHPQGRCTTVPVVAGLPVVEWQNGQSWFMTQSAENQRAMMGPGVYDAWQSGSFDLADLVKRVENDTWGTSLQTTTLKELTE